MYSSSTLGACAPWGCASIKIFRIRSLWNCNMVFWSTCCALLMPAVGHALLCLLLALLFFACCWLCSSLPAVGYALLCLLLAMLFLACCWLCSCHGSLGPNPGCFLHGFSGPNPDCLFMASRVPIPGCLFMGSRVPIPGCLFMGSVVQVTIVLRHRALFGKLALPLLVFFFFPPLALLAVDLSLFSDVASCERRVPRAPLCGSLRQCDRQSGTSNATTRSAPLRDRWFAVGTLASLCCSLQQRGPLSLRKFSLSGLVALPRCGLGPPT